MGLLLCTNEVLESDLVERLCDYLDAYGSFFARGSSAFEQHREFVREHRGMCTAKKITALQLMAELSPNDAALAAAGSSPSTRARLSGTSPSAVARPIGVSPSSPQPNPSPLRDLSDRRDSSSSPSSLRNVTGTITAKILHKEKEKEKEREKEREKEKSERHREKESPRVPRAGGDRSTDPSPRHHRKEKKEKTPRTGSASHSNASSASTTPVQSPRGPKLRKSQPDTLPVDSTPDQNERERAMLADLQAEVLTRTFTRKIRTCLLSRA